VVSVSLLLAVPPTDGETVGKVGELVGGEGDGAGLCTVIPAGVVGAFVPFALTVELMVELMVEPIVEPMVETPLPLDVGPLVGPEVTGVLTSGIFNLIPKSLFPTISPAFTLKHDDIPVDGSTTLVALG
jgi:hypothetical protein